MDSNSKWLILLDTSVKEHVYTGTSVVQTSGRPDYNRSQTVTLFLVGQRYHCNLRQLPRTKRNDTRVHTHRPSTACPHRHPLSYILSGREKQRSCLRISVLKTRQTARSHNSETCVFLNIALTSQQQSKATCRDQEEGADGWLSVPPADNYLCIIIPVCSLSQPDGRPTVPEAELELSLHSAAAALNVKD